jgi:ribosomal protein S18 acetylase RimI-like enzyme
VSAPPTVRIERLADHGRTTFDCGVPALDRYFRDQVGQDARRRVASCFVAVADQSGAVRGFYTLAAAGVALGDLPADLARRLPRYPSVPAYRVGRLAVDRAARGQGLGAALLADALLRAGRAEAAGLALVVDAKDETAAAFYRHHGFLELVGRPLALFLPLATAGKAQE